MNQTEMVQSLRAEIAKLQRVLDLLLDQSTTAEEVLRPGRPEGSANKATSFNPEEFAPKKRTMSAEGKARIVAAQKKRWAAQKTASPARVQRKQTSSAKKTSQTMVSTRASQTGRAAKKTAGAGKSIGSTQKPAASVRTRKTALKKTASEKTNRSATKRPAKQVAAASTESQAT